MENLPIYMLSVVVLFIFCMWHEDKKLMQEERDAFADERVDITNHYTEQIQSLLDRIQAPSFETFKTYEKPEENQIEPENTDVVDLSEAREDIENSEIAD